MAIFESKRGPVGIQVHETQFVTMHTRTVFHDLTFIILFAIVVFAIGTSLHTMCRTVSELDQHPTPAPHLKATSVAFL